MHRPTFELHVHSCDPVDPIAGGKYSPIVAETKLEIKDFSHRWLPIKDFPFCLHNYERLNRIIGLVG